MGAPKPGARRSTPGFADLVDAIGIETLRAHVAERRLLHVPAPAGFDAASLLSRAEVEEALIAGRVPPESVQFHGGYRQIEADSFRLFERGRVVAERLRMLASQKTTLVAVNLDRALARLWAFAREAELLLGDRVRIGAILSHDVETGIKPHHDKESLILVQIEGQKKWRFFGEPLGPSWRRNRPESEAEPELPVSAELVMRPGDLLFVPSGLRHVCEPAGESFHLGVLIDHLSGATLIGELRNRLHDDERFFAPLPRLLGSEYAEAELEQRRARLIAELETIDLNALLDAKRDPVARGERFEPYSP